MWRWLTAVITRVVITLLHKQGDRLEIKNWRPIMLLCVDYKIAAKAIANRLLSVLASVIHTDPACGVPGRNSAENVRLLHEIVAYANAKGTGGAVISLDQEKAFDRVEWSYLAQVLEKINFGPFFTAMSHCSTLKSGPAFTLMVRNSLCFQ